MRASDALKHVAHVAVQGLHFPYKVVRHDADAAQSRLRAPMSIHLGGVVLDKLVDKGAKGRTGVVENVGVAGVAPAEEVGEEGAVLAADVGGVGVAKLVHVAREQAGVRVADEEEAEVGRVGQQGAGLGLGVVGQVAQAGAGRVMGGGQVGVIRQPLPLAQQVLPVAVGGLRDRAEDQTVELADDDVRGKGGGGYVRFGEREGAEGLGLGSGLPQARQGGREEQ